MQYENTFKQIEQGCGSELDYLEQKYKIFFALALLSVILMLPVVSFGQKKELQTDTYDGFKYYELRDDQGRYKVEDLDGNTLVPWQPEGYLICYQSTGQYFEVFKSESKINYFKKKTGFLDLAFYSRDGIKLFDCTPYDQVFLHRTNDGRYFFEVYKDKKCAVLDGGGNMLIPFGKKDRYGFSSKTNTLNRMVKEGRLVAYKIVGDEYEDTGVGLPDTYKLRIFPKGSTESGAEFALELSNNKEDLKMLIPDNSKSKETVSSGQKELKDIRKAAENGDANAQFELGWELTSDPNADDKTMEEAVKWFRKSAAQGHAEAQRCMGDSYANGWGVKQSYANAERWYKKAIAQGNEDAQEGLDRLYAECPEKQHCNPSAEVQAKNPIRFHGVEIKGNINTFIAALRRNLQGITSAKEDTPGKYTMENHTGGFFYVKYDPLTKNVYEIELYAKSDGDFFQSESDKNGFRGEVLAEIKEKYRKVKISRYYYLSGGCSISIYSDHIYFTNEGAKKAFYKREMDKLLRSNLVSKTTDGLKSYFKSNGYTVTTGYWGDHVHLFGIETTYKKQEESQSISFEMSNAGQDFQNSLMQILQECYPNGIFYGGMWCNINGTDVIVGEHSLYLRNRIIFKAKSTEPTSIKIADDKKMNGDIDPHYSLSSSYLIQDVTPFESNGRRYNLIFTSWRNVENATYVHRVFVAPSDYDGYKLMSNRATDVNPATVLKLIYHKLPDESKSFCGLEIESDYYDIEQDKNLQFSLLRQEIPVPDAIAQKVVDLMANEFLWENKSDVKFEETKEEKLREPELSSPLTWVTSHPDSSF